jgi:hypothetical protein
MIPSRIDIPGELRSRLAVDATAPDRVLRRTRMRFAQVALLVESALMSATLVPVCPRTLRLSRPPIDQAPACAALVDQVVDLASRFKARIKPLLDGNCMGFLLSHEMLSSRRETLSILPSITPDQGRDVSN